MWVVCVGVCVGGGGGEREGAALMIMFEERMKNKKPGLFPVM